MSSYETEENAKNYKMFANPVFITPGKYEKLKAESAH